MKFSDMMGKRDRSRTEVDEPTLPPEAGTAPPLPEAPIRFGGVRSELDDAAAAFGSVSPPPPPPATVLRAPTPVVAPPPASTPVPPAEPSIREVMAELAPRPAIAPIAATDRQLDTSAWLDGIDHIDDDLLPH